MTASGVTPEGPAATRCEVCLRPVGRGQCERGPRYEHTGDADCYAAGYSRLLATVANFRENYVAASRLDQVSADAKSLRARLVEVERDVLRWTATAIQSEGAARTLREAMQRIAAPWPRWRDLRAYQTDFETLQRLAGAALSGLPPLASETVGPRTDAQALALSHLDWIIGYAESTDQPGLLNNAQRARTALATPAALVPKEEDK